MSDRTQLEEYIASIEDPVRRKKLEQFQWRLDNELSKYKDPIARYNRMVELFWEGVRDLQTALENPSSLIDKEEGPIPDNVVKLKKD